MEKKKYTGTVIWFNSGDGYGFIFHEGHKDLFVHFSDLVQEGFRTLKKDQVVEFEIGENNKGIPKAIEVVVISG